MTKYELIRLIRTGRTQTKQAQIATTMRFVKSAFPAAVAAGAGAVGGGWSFSSLLAALANLALVSWIIHLFFQPSGVDFAPAPQPTQNIPPSLLTQTTQPETPSSLPFFPIGGGTTRIAREPKDQPVASAAPTLTLSPVGKGTVAPPVLHRIG